MRLVLIDKGVVHKAAQAGISANPMSAFVVLKYDSD
jgi:hypothetical protein